MAFLYKKTFLILLQTFFFCHVRYWIPISFKHFTLLISYFKHKFLDNTWVTYSLYNLVKVKICLTGAIRLDESDIK